MVNIREVALDIIEPLTLSEREKLLKMTGKGYLLFKDYVPSEYAHLLENELTFLLSS